MERAQKLFKQRPILYFNANQYNLESLPIFLNIMLHKISSMFSIIHSLILISLLKSTVGMNRLPVESRLISFQIFKEKMIEDRGYRILKKTLLKLQTSFRINSTGWIRPLSNYHLLWFTKIMEVGSGGCRSSAGHRKAGYGRPFLGLLVIASFMINAP